MAANPAFMDGFEDAESQPKQGRRSWASNVPYDLLDNTGDVIDMRATKPEAPVNSARSTSAQASSRVTSSITYRPVRQTTTLAPEQELWRPVAGNATSRLAAEASSPLSRSNARLGIYAMLAAVAVVVLYVAVSAVVSWTQVRMDDLTYGRPRTTHLDAAVGHGDSLTQPTHFIALNLNRQVSIIEIPGGDISKAVAISGPYLFGEGEDLTPVKLQLSDLNGDGMPDLLVDVKSEQIAYINENNTFRPISGEEKAALDQAYSAAAGQ